MEVREKKIEAKRKKMEIWDFIMDSYLSILFYNGHIHHVTPFPVISFFLFFKNLIYIHGLHKLKTYHQNGTHQLGVTNELG